MKRASVKRGHRTPKARKLVDNKGIHAAIKVVDDGHVEDVRVVKVKVSDGYRGRRYGLGRAIGRLQSRKAVDFTPGTWGHIHNPEIRRTSSGKRVGRRLRRVYRYGKYPVGARSRTLIAAWLAKVFVAETGGKEKTWVSLSGGTVAPTMLMIHAARLDKPSLRFIKFDIDDLAISEAKSHAENEGILSVNISAVTGDIFDKNLVLDTVKPGGADIVDLTGLFEYLDDEQSVAVLRMAYQILKPGGAILASNVRSNILPGATPRSIAQIKELIDKSRLKTDKISVYQPSDGVYNVIYIRKTAD